MFSVYESYDNYNQVITYYLKVCILHTDKKYLIILTLISLVGLLVASYT